MAAFNITVINPATQQQKQVVYDSDASTLRYAEGDHIVPLLAPSRAGVAVVTSRDDPATKTNAPKTLKISLGLSCNYECSYCSQRFVPHAGETNKDDIGPFLAQLGGWMTSAPERVEFWGGEPLVYWKTLKPLAEALRARWPYAQLTMVTNGSILTPDINLWLDEMGFNIGLSHDGPGFHARGLDPLDDPERRANILDLWKRLGPSKRMSVNAMMHKDNLSRAAVQSFLTEVFGEDLNIGEGTFVDPYDEGGMASSLEGSKSQIEYRRRAFAELRSGQASKFVAANEKVMGFIHSLRTRRPLSAVGQKCGMDRSDNLAVDLKGNVLTCQNVSAVSFAPNGESHKIGHVSDFGSIKLKTSTHWSKRAECPKCPVVQICQGSCMFLEGPLWEAGCNNAFSDNIAFFAAAIEFLTGCVPVYIDGPQRQDRRDIFGLVCADKGESVTRPSRQFPIRVVAA